MLSQTGILKKPKKTTVGRAREYNGRRGFPLVGMLQDVSSVLFSLNRQAAGDTCVKSAKYSGGFAGEYCMRRIRPRFRNNHEAQVSSQTISEKLTQLRYKVFCVVPDTYRRRCIWRRIFI